MFRSFRSTLEASIAPDHGVVSASSLVSLANDSSRLAPHISSFGRKLTQNAGRSGWPKIAQRMSGNNCTHGIPAGLPCGMPGIGEVIEGAMQHAPHCERQSMPLSLITDRADATD